VPQRFERLLRALQMLTLYPKTMSMSAVWTSSSSMLMSLSGRREGSSSFFGVWSWLSAQPTS